MKLDLTILAGFETDIKKINRKKSLFSKNYKVNYLEGQPKAITISNNQTYLAQKIIDIANESKFIDKVFLLGPSWMYKDRLKYCEFINYNHNLASNICKSVSVISENSSSGLGAIITSDLPLLTLDDFNDYFESIEEQLLKYDKDLVVQVVDKKESLKGLENGYDKPGFLLRDDSGGIKEFIIGHCYAGHLDRVKDSFIELAGMMYGNRGINKFLRVPVGVLKAFKTINVSSLIKEVIPKYPDYSSKELSVRDCFSLLEKTIIPEKDYKGSGKHFSFQVVKNQGFAFDPDTEEEVVKIGFNYVPVEELLCMDYQEILNNSKIF